MCWVCNPLVKTGMAQNYWADQLGMDVAHFTALSQGDTTALLTDSAGEGTSPTTALVVAGPDEAGDGIGKVPGNPTLTVDGGPITATIGLPGDQDFFKVTLEAGKTYQIGQYANTEGGVPLADAYFEVYSASGKLLLSADGGGPNTPSGLDALQPFTPETTGTYYINARAFDNDGTNGTTGDFVGDYDLFVNTAPEGQATYQPFYDIDSPLHSLDWGSEFRRSSRNPDSDNGTRTDNGVTQKDNLTDYRTGIDGKNVVTYYFAKQGDAFVSEDPTTPGLTADIVQGQNITQYERDAYRLAFDQYEEVADVVYVEVQNRNEADLKIITYAGTPGPGASLLGRASPPGEESEGQMEFNSADERYNPAGLTQGGFFFTTILHEFGHAHGMAHPHDNGGRSSIMRGAGGGTAGIGGAYGDFGLSQGVFTIMSYNDGYDLRPDGTPKPDDNADNGWVGSLSPLDIAVIQDKYGVNEEYARGNNTYVIKDVQDTGTFYDSIWDGGGTDIITYGGARNAVIDLRAATLKYEVGGGGRVSYVTGISGGYTIANGATIENATSGSGNDVLIGNTVANILTAGAGNDVLNGLGGADTMTGGTGNDTYHVDSASDRLVEGTSAGRDLVISSVTFTLLGTGADDLTLIGSANLNGTGNELVNTIIGNSGRNYINGGVAGDTMKGGRGDDTYRVDHRFDTVIETSNEGIDTVVSSVSFSFVGKSLENLTLVGKANTGTGNGWGNRMAGNDLSNTLSGLDGNDRIDGGSGHDRIFGGAGLDSLQGGVGGDSFFFDTALNANNVDDILDFRVVDDSIVLDRSIFNAIGANGTLSASAFRTGTSAGDASDRIIYDKVNGNIFYDADGTGAAAKVLIATVDNGLALTNADFIAIA